MCNAEQISGDGHTSNVWSMMSSCQGGLFMPGTSIAAMSCRLFKFSPRLGRPLGDIRPGVSNPELVIAGTRYLDELGYRLVALQSTEAYTGFEDPCGDPAKTICPRRTASRFV